MTVFRMRTILVYSIIEVQYCFGRQYQKQAIWVSRIVLTILVVLGIIHNAFYFKAEYINMRIVLSCMVFLMITSSLAIISTSYSSKEKEFSIPEYWFLNGAFVYTIVAAFTFAVYSLLFIGNFFCTCFIPLPSWFFTD